MTGKHDPCDEGAGSPASPRLWSVDEHLADVLFAAAPLPPIELRLLEAQGLRLAEDVHATADLPPFDNSSMDGYALRTADTVRATDEYPSVLAVVGDIAAGAGELPKVGPGQAARIMTGAPVPPGAEAVAPVEWTDGGTGTGQAADAMGAGGEGAEVRVLRPVAEGAFIRRRGSDVTAGDTVLESGALLGPAQLGLLAAIGRATVRVRPRPRVVVLSTGSELVQPGEETGPGRIHDSNSFTLTAAATAAGAVAYRVGGVPDEASTLRAVLEDQLGRADLIVTSGGVSVGAYDVVKEVFADYAGVDFRRLRMQPGKPQGYGRIGGDQGVPLLALPGNPVSAYISFELFVRPVIRTMLGAPDVHRPVVRAATTAALRSPAGRRQFLRGRYHPADGTVSPVGGEGSHLVGALAKADCLITVPEDTTAVPAGSAVDVVLLTD
ncbi:gephyrin-like molybdotransferase Glp [Kitasatospora cheerisanensis]|uniref:Molybdopterin molybdenumtransferase n=1 Tax=Kitasatospora cheerisanensis KCTC 2395 TaxID=1348663 RepID=A0A066Z174_9ACTN|nr:gephyrin-like molybdotransferase Glp [Kitasatospora cheerisanensis]KDN83930.1 molybdopterin biosynthesis protein MoeA [Kitasatospora cheerisanensis KCTC 2395]